MRQPRNRGSERIEKKPVEIETMSFVGLVGAINAIRIKLTGTDPAYPDMPHIAGAVAGRIQLDCAGRRCVFGVVEQLQPDAAGVTAENREIDTPAEFVVSEGQRGTGANVGVLGGLRDV